MTILTQFAAVVYFSIAALATWVRLSGENDLYIGAVTALLVWASVLLGVVFVGLYLVMRWA